MCLAWRAVHYEHYFSPYKNKWLWNISNGVITPEDDWINTFMDDNKLTAIYYPHGGLFTISSDIASAIINNTIVPYNEGVDDTCIGYILYHLKIEVIDYESVTIYVEKDYKQIYTTDKFCFRIKHHTNRHIRDIDIHSLLLDIYYPHT
jgi:hypothetical protein